ELKELDQQMQMAPLLASKPQVQIIGKKVIIKMIDSHLLDHTTYRLSLGSALVDNREATPYSNFNYTFSTGNYFDTLEIRGKVMNAVTGLPDTAATILLYDAAASDSIVFRQRPIYAIKADASGVFHQPNMPNRAFKIFAINDANNNLVYDPFVEKIAFSDSLIYPKAHFEAPLLLSTFTEIRAEISKPISDSTNSELTDSVTTSTTASRSGIKLQNVARPKGKSSVPFRVLVDTRDQTQRTV